MNAGLEIIAVVFTITLVVVFSFSLFYGEDYANGCEALGYTANGFTPIIVVYECREITETEKTFTDRYVHLQKVNGVWKEKVGFLGESDER